MNRYRVKKIFPTWQGEGYHTGTRSMFVRLVGCNLWSGLEKDRHRDAVRHGVTCPMWCDTDFTPTGSDSLTAVDVLDRLREHYPHGGVPVVITGGEPFLQVDDHLITTLRGGGFRVHVETNGTVRIGDRLSVFPDWITCSPKTEEERVVLETMSEIKLVVPDYQPEMFPNLIRVQSERGVRLFVQPCDDPPRDNIRTCLAITRKDPRWRISLQTHKMMGVE